MNITDATAIQEKAIPLGLKGVSPLAISSETGSGKTLSYLIPFLNGYCTDPTQRLLVILPRKELAYQLDTVLHKLVPDIQSHLAITKTGEIGRGVYPNVIIGTPKPVYTLVRSVFAKCNVEKLVAEKRAISTIVLDEADVILNDPFQREVLECIRVLTKINRDVKLIVAGATIPRNGKCTPGGVLDRKYPSITWCEGQNPNTVPPSIQVEFEETADDAAKAAALQKLAPSLRSGSNVVFVQNALRGKAVVEALAAANVKAQLLCQDMTDRERELAVKRVLGEEAMCTVCTDIVGRGLDTTRVEMVVQYDFARDVSSFLHRCGRTGRNGREGRVMCFVTPENALLYKQILVMLVCGADC
ncbi:hypothetical protein WA556_007100 [Blastocystis sp. ATCC 50177/Nand II]